MTGATAGFDSAAPFVPNRHIRALDGMRGMAIAMVVTFHLSFGLSEAFSSTRAARAVSLSGWIGVDLFFVLSGLLVTRGFLAGERTWVAYRLFLARRALRILPLYYIALSVGSALDRSPDIWHWIYLQNYSLPFSDRPEGWSAHFWSLGVEEQFYLVWPLVLVLAARARPRALFRGLFAALVVVAVGRALLVVGLAHRVDGYLLAKIVYRATPTRLDGLLAGCVVACLHHGSARDLLERWRKVRPAFAGTSFGVLAVLAVSIGMGNEDRRFVVLGYPCLAVLFGALASFVIDDDRTWLHAALELRPLRYVGTVSYGVYVVHWPLVACAIPHLRRIHATTTSAWAAVGVAGVTTVLVWAVSLMVAHVSFVAIERPILALKSRLPQGGAPSA